MRLKLQSVGSWGGQGIHEHYGLCHLGKDHHHHHLQPVDSEELQDGNVFPSQVDQYIVRLVDHLLVSYLFFFCFMGILNIHAIMSLVLAGAMIFKINGCPVNTPALLNRTSFSLEYWCSLFWCQLSSTLLITDCTSEEQPRPGAHLP